MPDNSISTIVVKCLTNFIKLGSKKIDPMKAEYNNRKKYLKTPMKI